jgi:small multidrug resistance pump
MAAATSWGYLYLAIGIFGEVCATAALKATEEFTKPLPSLICLAGYATGLFFLALTLRTIPVGIAYSIWAGAGTALIALSGYILYGQRLDITAIIGMTLIVAGVATLNFSSSSVTP